MQKPPHQPYNQTENINKSSLHIPRSVNQKLKRNWNWIAEDISIYIQAVSSACTKNTTKSVCFARRDRPNESDKTRLTTLVFCTLCVCITHMHELAPIYTILLNAWHVQRKFSTQYLRCAIEVKECARTVDTGLFAR